MTARLALQCSTCGVEEVTMSAIKSNTSAEYYTVVYRVEGDCAQHSEWWHGLRPLFLADGSPPVSITVIARGDLLDRLDRLADTIAKATPP
jgi:hypothetical protein